MPKGKMRSPEENVTQERLREVLDYDPETGIFVWKDVVVHYKKRKPKVEKGGWVAGCKSVHGYIVIGVDQVRYQAGRLAWLYVHGTLGAGMEIDHINGDPLDNRIANLRVATRAQNSRNVRAKNPKSGFKGVRWHGQCNKWVAAITYNYKTLHLGLFVDPQEAHKVYLDAARNLFGDFARSA